MLEPKLQEKKPLWICHAMIRVCGYCCVPHAKALSAPNIHKRFSDKKRCHGLPIYPSGSKINYLTGDRLKTCYY